MTRKTTAAVILAAGRGTRMGGATSKVVLDIQGKPLVRHIVDTCREAGAEPVIVVVGENEEEVYAALGKSVRYAKQAQPMGTGHALKCAISALGDFHGNLLVMVGDAPFIESNALSQLIEHRERGDHAASILTATFDPTPPYARILRDRQELVVAAIEERLCTPAQKAITEVLTSHYCLDWRRVFPHLNSITPDPKSGEYYLTDLIAILNGNGETIAASRAPESWKTMGLNTPEDIAACLARMNMD